MIARNAEDKGIITIAMTSLPEHFNLGYPHLTNFKYVRLALGFHPMLAGKNRFDENLFRSLAAKTSYIGEIGLDFSEKDTSRRQSQIDVLDKIFEIVNDRPRFISVHSRRAEKSLFDTLSNHKIKKAVFHWYSGPLNLIDKIVSTDQFFSINPSMIKSKNGQKIIERIPADRALTETDGPYVKVNGRPAEPESVKYVVNHLSQVWNRSSEEVTHQIKFNFSKIIQHIKKN
jgi:TatD DNase family protein